MTVRHRVLPALIVLIAFLVPQDALAQRDFGLGVIIGEPTGLSAKWWVSPGNAFDAGAAWSFADNPSLQLHGDYLYHRNYHFDSPDLEGTLPWYFGIGGRMKLSDDDDPGRRNVDDDLLGVRFPVGVGWTFDEAPIEVFLELVPIIDIAPETDFSINGALGARYYFR